MVDWLCLRQAISLHTSLLERNSEMLREVMEKLGCKPTKVAKVIGSGNNIALISVKPPESKSQELDLSRKPLYSAFYIKLQNGGPWQCSSYRLSAFSYTFTIKYSPMSSSSPALGPKTYF